MPRTPLVDPFFQTALDLLESGWTPSKPRFRKPRVKSEDDYEYDLPPRVKIKKEKGVKRGRAKSKTKRKRVKKEPSSKKEEPKKKIKIIGTKWEVSQGMAQRVKRIGTKLEVWQGQARMTKGGLFKKDLTQNKKLRVVSKIQSKRGKVKQITIKSWLASVKQAKKELGIVGFIVINRGPLGVKVYKRAKILQAEAKKRSGKNY